MLQTISGQNMIEKLVSKGKEKIKFIKTCTKPLQRGHRRLHFYAPNNVCSHMNNEVK